MAPVIFLNPGKSLTVTPVKKKKKKIAPPTPKKKRKKEIPPRLKKKKKKKPSILLLAPRKPKVLDIVSSILLEPTTFIKSPTQAAFKVEARRKEIRKTGDVGKALDVVGETLTAAGIGAAGILAAGSPAAAGGIALKALPKTLKGQITAFTAGGILVTSKQARKLAGKFIQDPTKIGREAGLLIDKALSGKDVGGVGEALKKAGIVGAIVAGGVGAVALTKKIFGGKGESTKTPDQAINTPSQVPGSIALPISVIPDALTPIVEAPVIAETPKVDAVGAPSAEINVKVINKPQINVAVAQSL